MHSHVFLRTSLHHSTGLHVYTLRDYKSIYDYYYIINAVFHTQNNNIIICVLGGPVGTEIIVTRPNCYFK